MDKVIFRLTGGVGNQLFTYAAGQYLSEVKRVPVVFDLTDRYIEKSFHQSDIRNLNLDGVFENKILNILRAEGIRTQLKFNPKGVKFKNTYVSNVVGFDPVLDENFRANRVRGYFQCFNYANYPAVKTKIKQARLSYTGKYFEEILKNIVNSNAISLHIRRGDYLKNAQTHGLLSSEYFNKAIEMIFDLNNSAKQVNHILIFSDDLQEAAKVIEQTKIAANYIYIDNSKLSDEESLVLMSKPKNIVISNSTFSWWGAWLGNDEKNVIAPSKWFKGLEDPANLIPQDWKLCKSTWDS